ncbi:MAG: PHP domain-containing protein [Desulfobacteraceae bacterium]|nr:PHP domain-containing protein [Desulfobacteraceae bacterium]
MDCNRSRCIDLHIHSQASDGSLSAADIIEKAETLSLGAISITDHDTLDGSKEAVSLIHRSPVRFLTGVEISANPPESFNIPGSLHVLGYHIDLDNHELNQALQRLQASRTQRIPRMIDRLNAIGMSISMADVMVHVGTSIPGRPHVAAAMIDRGYAVSIDDAFERFLGRGKPAYVDKFRIEAHTIIQTIHNAGGVPVLAHPYLIEKPPEIIDRLIHTLKDMGLMGLEVLYPGHSTEAVASLTRTARKNDLLITGGTDFHGDINPNIKMGSGGGDLFVPYELYEKLVAATDSG